jgi:ATP-binding cassette, subfamily B, bacterial
MVQQSFPAISFSTLKQTLPRALRLVWTMAPGWTAVNLVLVFVLGVLPIAGLYLTKLIVNAVTEGLAATQPASAFSHVFLFILIAAGIALVLAIARSLSELTSNAQSMIVTDGVSDILHNQSVAVDLAYYEDPGYYDTLYRAQQEAPYRPTRIVNGLVQMGQNLISLLGVAVLILTFSWMLALVIFAAAIPAALARYYFARVRFRFEQDATEDIRQASYYHWVLTDSSHAKEIRLFNLGSLFLNRFREIRTGIRGGRMNLACKGALADVLSQGVAVIALFSSYAYIAYSTLNGSITIGDLVMYFLAFQLGLGYIQAILGTLAGLYEDNLFLSNFYQFLDLRPAIVSPPSPVRVPRPADQKIEFRDVHFSYPGGAKDAVTGVNLVINPGEVIALVGENGSGKTTLMKLLCRLYDTDKGAITVNGISLRDLDPVAWRKEIGVVFQDYVHYFLSAGENIWVGDIEHEPDGAHIAAAAHRSGIDPVIRKFPEGYQTKLGHWFYGGQELSEGEWQKVALARAFFRNSQLVILDEPSSSLDPLAEAELFRNFRHLLEGRSAVLISHRFSTVVMADRIYMLEKGRIIEQGTHEELLQMNGRYAFLFRTQAESYHEHPAKSEGAISYIHDE